MSINNRFKPDSKHETRPVFRFQNRILIKSPFSYITRPNIFNFYHYIYYIYVCVYVYMRLLKKYCHRLRSLCDGKMCAEQQGENMSESSRINRLH